MRLRLREYGKNIRDGKSPHTRMNVMITCDQKTLDRMEDKYPGILKSVRYFEEAVLPACCYCGSEDTASVQCGVIGRTTNIAAATTKFKLIANGPKTGKYFCNTCEKFFGKLSKLIDAAEEGNADAQYELATEYRVGENLEQDYEHALKWYSRAAEAGHIDALNDLGSMLLNGMGCAKDAEAAVECYRKAADAGHTQAMFNLALRYLHGDGVEMRADYAASLLFGAVEAGHLEATGQLGTLFMLGNGVDQDYAVAARLHWIAARDGDVTSMGNLASYRSKLEDLAFSGVQSAAMIRGHLLSRGWGDDPQKSRAFAWYRWAAEKCEPDDDCAEEVAFCEQLQASLSATEKAECQAAFDDLQKLRMGRIEKG
jgi:TPR repeat protein